MTAEQEPKSAPGGEPGTVQRPVVKKAVGRSRRPDLDTLFSINADGSRNAIQPADCSGRYQTRKHLLWYVLIGVYLLMPWVRVDGHPAILIDIAQRHFYLFGHTFNAQDFWLAFFFVSGLGFTLFVVAALWGRLWCGYACPQTVFLEGVFRRIERLIEGNAAARVRLDKGKLDGGKFLRRGTKLVLYLAISLLITHSLLGYFMPVQEVVAAMTSPPSEHLTAFVFVLVLTTLVFVNFTWFREQTCIVVCPYGRLQGALYDPDTLLVAYDKKRGEPRGPAGTEGAGDCIDCFRCVAVCPTGIDIRNGTQMECVGCANCIDACDDVMAKLGRDKGLVRYDTQRGFETQRRRFWRPRVFVYVVLLLLGCVVFARSVMRRSAFEANVIRPPGAAFVVEDGRLRNLMQLHLVNKLPTTALFRVTATSPAGVEITIAQSELRLESLQDQRIPVVVQMPVSAFVEGSEVHLRVVAAAETTADQDAQPAPIEITTKAAILGPRQRR
ncbi:MAG: cytochrome c oxidase accessory protein CcoG [Planctomycetota bacterium]